jgi:predicted permease
MPDWKELVRHHLPSLPIAAEREVEIVEELAQCLEARYQELRLAGEPEEKALSAALNHVGDWEALGREILGAERPLPPAVLNGWNGLRDDALTTNIRSVRMLANLLQDVKYAIRGLRGSPGFSAIAVLIMGLGIGANTSMFSFVNAILLQQSLSYRNPSEVVRICSTRPNSSTPSWTSYPDFLDFRDQGGLFASAAVASDGTPMSLLTEEGSEFIVGEAYSAALFSIMDIPISLGRSFLPEEDKPGCDPVVIISHSVWQSRYGGDPNILGRTLRINGHPITVVGVGPKEFRGTLIIFSSDYWLSLGTADRIESSYIHLDARNSREYRMYARLKPGVTIEQAGARLNTLAETLGQMYPDTNAKRRVIVFPATEVHLDPLVDKALYPLSGFLMAVVGLVLLVACSNLAGFLLTRAAARRKEIAIRLALGAGRQRLVAQLLTESILLGVLGGGIGLIIAFWAGGALSSLKLPLPIVMTIQYRVDATVLSFTLLLSVATGILFGLAPALKAARCDIVATMKNEAPSLRVGRRRVSLRNALAVGQFAVSLILLLAAGLLLRSLIHANRADVGFRPEHLAAATVDASLGGYKSESEGRIFFDRYREKVASVPGIESVTLASRLPLGLWGSDTSRVYLSGAHPESEEDVPQIESAVVGVGYFDVMGIPVLHGRKFLEADGASAPRVAIVSEAMARRFWKDVDPVGESIFVGSIGQEISMRVIGVARDTKVKDIKEEPQPYLYIPFAQQYSPLMSVIARTAGDPAGVPEIFRRALKSLNSDVPLFEAKPMREHLGIRLYTLKMAGTFLTAFGVLALSLAGIGLYGLVAFSVAQRTREIGIRMALGADRKQVVAMVLGRGFVIVAFGLAIGLPAAIMVMLPLSGLLVNVSAADPVTLAAVVLLLALVTITASYIPARRASRLDPLVSLHHE